MKTMNRMDWLGVGSIAALAVAGAVACSSSSSPPAGEDGGGSSSGVSASSSGGGTSSSSGVTSSSSSSGGSSSSSSGASSGDTGAPPADGGSEGGQSDGGSEGGDHATLTVLNFDTWCSVTINGGAPSALGTITASVPVGSTATIVATSNGASFRIGADPWFGVSQNDGGAAPGTDVGSGATETTTATVVVTGATHCVSVCCEEPGNTPIPCPTTNPCP